MHHHFISESQEPTLKRSHSAFISRMHTPLQHLNPNIILSKSLCPDTDEAKALMSHTPYLTAVGLIMYVAMGTCPDMAFAIQHLSQYTLNPGQAHWTAAKQVVKYLYATCDHTLVLGRPGKIKLQGFTDSNWGADVNNCCSVSGYLFSLVLPRLDSARLRLTRCWLQLDLKH